MTDLQASLLILNQMDLSIFAEPGSTDCEFLHMAAGGGHVFEVRGWAKANMDRRAFAWFEIDDEDQVFPLDLSLLPEPAKTPRELTAEYLSRQTGFDVRWRGSCYSLFDGENYRAPLYTSADVKKTAARIKKGNAKNGIPPNNSPSLSHS